MKDSYHTPDTTGDFPTSADVPSISLPWAEVLRNRADFPQACLSFHLDLTCDGLHGLADLTRVLADSGLHLRVLRATQTGGVHCILIDDRCADLSGLAATLPRVARLQAWVTQIEFQPAAKVG